MSKNSEFKNPSNQYRGRPFWSWNGNLKKDELLRQIDILEEMGFGGYFCHSRTGLETEYLGEEWFDLINTCADYGETKGMDSWLYDEDRWPSGSAGGLVAAKEENRMRYLQMHQSAPQSFLWDDKALITFACKLDGVSFSDERVLCKEDTVNDDETVIWFTEELFRSSDNYNGFSYVDTMNKATTLEFIKSTHEKYKAHCGSRLGKTIPGIFTDEPHRGALFSEFSEGNTYAAPYTPKLFEEFEKRFGYDVKPRLLEFFLRKNGEEISQVTWHYIELCQELFVENFAKPIYEWCTENHIAFTGHVLHEDSFTCQTVMQGSLMRFYEYMHNPGIDILTENNNVYWAAKQLSSVARQCGQKWLLSELYGCTGWQLNFRSHKAIGDWQALFGINFRCQHLSWYTMKGEAKRDYPASIFHQSAWYKEYKYVEDYFSRLNVVLTEGSPDCELLVINGLESVWARSYAGCYNWLTAVDPEILRLEKQYADIFLALAGNRIDFDYGDEEMVGRLGSVKDNGILEVGKAKYKTVLVAGVDTIRSTTVNLLEAFMKAGGKVVFAGKIPDYMDALKSSKPAEIAQNAIHIELTPDAIAQNCATGREVKTVGKNIETLFAQTRLTQEGKYIVLMNVDRENGYNNVQLDLGTGGYAEAWNPETGEIESVEYTVDNGKILVCTDLPPVCTKIYLIKQSGNQLPIKKEKVLFEQKAPEEYEYKLDEPNLCVLDKVSISINTKEFSPELDVLKADSKIRDVLGLPYRGGTMLQPWFANKYRNAQDTVCGQVAVRYEFFINELPQKDVELVVEEAQNYHAVKINGNALDTVNTNGKWIDICFDKLNLPKEYLHTGSNMIELSFDYKPTSGCEAVYILGNFGVTLRGDKPVIDQLPEKLKIGDITPQHLPFYSGKLSYVLPVSQFKGKKALITVENFKGACVKIKNSTDEKIIAWEPYTAEITDLIRDTDTLNVEVVLTRRNTFGPLHQLPAIVSSYGPTNFLTVGDEWSDAYVLLEQGLLSAPVITVLE